MAYVWTEDSQTPWFHAERFNERRVLERKGGRPWALGGGNGSKNREERRARGIREGKRKRREKAAPYIVRYSWLLPGNCGAEHAWLFTGS